MSMLSALILMGVHGAAPAEVLARACLSAHDAQACVQMSRALDHGNAEQHYREEPLHYLAIACQLGAERACVDAEATAQRYSEFELVETDAGCMLEGNGFACEEVGQALLREGKFWARTWANARLARAVDLYSAGCARGEAAACLGRGRLLSGKTALRSFVRGCELGSARACSAAAERASGHAALRMLELGCGGSEAEPHICFALAQRSESLGLPWKQVRERYARACMLGHPKACARASPR